MYFSTLTGLAASVRVKFPNIGVNWVSINLTFYNYLHPKSYKVNICEHFLMISRFLKKFLMLGFCEGSCIGNYVLTEADS